MTVSSVSSSSTAALQRVQRPDDATASRQADAPPPEKDKSTQAKPPEQAAPVVNTQGQVTGRLLNVSA